MEDTLEEEEDNLIDEIGLARVTEDKGVYTHVEHTGEEIDDTLDVQQDALGDAEQGNIDVDINEGLDVLDCTLEDLLDLFEAGGYNLHGGRDGIELG